MSDLVNLVDLPSSDIYDELAKPTKPVGDKSKHFDVIEFLTEFNRPFNKKEKENRTIYEIDCPCKDHDRGGGAWICQQDNGYISAGCNHPDCKGKKWKHFRQAIDPNFDEKANATLPTKVDDVERLANCHSEKYPNKFVLYNEIICEYQDGVYIERSEKFIKRQLRRTIATEFHIYAQLRRERGLDSDPPSISESLVSSVYGMFTSIIPEVTTPAPCMLDGSKATNLIIVKNGILNLDDLSKTEHTYKLFSFVKLPYDYLPDALCPNWFKFLDSIWTDSKNKDLLQEIFGYIIQNGNPLEIWILLQGATRGGKGVCLDMGCAVAGEKNSTSIQIKKIAGQFSLWKLHNKLVIRIPDIQSPKLGLSSEVVEFIKSVSGLEMLDIEQKHRDSFDARIEGKIFASSNDILEFNDPSGALFARLIVLKFTKSFLPSDDPDYEEGQDQDSTLKTKLLDELPGMLNWALIGAKRLKENGRFTQPEESINLKRELREEGAPIKQFVKDWLILDPKGSVLVKKVFDRWMKYGGDVKDTPKIFGKLLRAACPTVRNDKAKTVHADGTRPHTFFGITLKDEATEQTTEQATDNGAT